MNPIFIAAMSKDFSIVERARDLRNEMLLFKEVSEAGIHMTYESLLSLDIEKKNLFLEIDGLLNLCDHTDVKGESALISKENEIVCKICRKVI